MDLAEVLVVRVLRIILVPALLMLTPASGEARQAVQHNGAAGAAGSLEAATEFEPVPLEAPRSNRAAQLAQLRATDYVVSLEPADAAGAGRSRPVSRMRGGDWIVQTWRGAGHEEINYFNVRTAADITLFRNSDGSLRQISIQQRDDAERDRPIASGETQRVLGETCTIWRTQPSGPGVQMIRESCVTADGIELWSRTLSDARPIGRSLTVLSGGVRVTSIRRERVGSARARPPRDLFEWARWRSSVQDQNVAQGENTTPSSPPNYDVWLEEGTPVAGRIVASRHANGWRAERNINWHAGGRWQAFDLNYGARLQLNFRNGRGPYGRSLTIVSRPDAPQDFASRAVRMDESQNVLGRSCQWFDTAPEVSDASDAECRTVEGFVLAERHWNRGGAGYDVTAVRLDAPSASQAIDPPPQIFTWARALVR